MLQDCSTNVAETKIYNGEKSSGTTCTHAPRTHTCANNPVCMHACTHACARADMQHAEIHEINAPERIFYRVARSQCARVPGSSLSRFPPTSSSHPRWRSLFFLSIVPCVIRDNKIFRHVYLTEIHFPVFFTAALANFSRVPSRSTGWSARTCPLNELKRKTVHTRN